MQITSLSKALAFPFVLLIIFYFTSGRFISANIDTWTLIPAVISLMLLYVFNEPIDKWWWKKRPPSLDPKIKSWVEVYSPIYKSLSSDLKQRFEERLSIFMRLKDFTVKVKKDFHLEEDMKALLSHDFIRLTLHRDEYLLPAYEHFVLYNHAFGTPNFQFLHSFEYNDEDGVVIFSREELVNGFNLGLDYFNIGLYGAISTFISSYPRLKYPNVADITIEQLCTDLQINLESIVSTLGFKEISKLSMLIYAYFEYSERLQSLYPEKHADLELIFGPAK